MKTQCLRAAIAVALATFLPAIAADNTFHMTAIPLSGSPAPSASAPAVRVVSVTIAASSSVTVNSCVGGTQGCPDPTPGYASIPFPAAVLPLNGGTYITLMFQDISYTGPIEISIFFVQNGVVVGQPSRLGSGLSIAPGFLNLLDTGTTIPPQASPGPTAVVVSINYGGKITRGSQGFTLQ